MKGDQPSVGKAMEEHTGEVLNDDGKREPQVSERKPGIYKLKQIVASLKMEKKKAKERVTAAVKAVEMDKGIQRGSERAIQPTATLRNKLCGLLRDIRLSFAGLDVRQCPAFPTLGDELEAQNAVLGQKHIFLENVHLARAAPLREGMIAVKVLVQRPAEHRLESVRTKGARQHAHVAKQRLERFVEDITDFVLKVLSRHQGVEQLDAVFDHSMNFAARTTQVGSVIECLP